MNNLNIFKLELGLGSYKYKRFYSEIANLARIENFYEWLSGLTDGEGYFIIAFANEGSSFLFKFEIGLPIDDAKMLSFIQENLGIGKVSVYGNRVTYSVTKKEDIAKLLEIFTKYPLESTKYLNFSDFKRAFNLYTSVNKITTDLLKEIGEIKSGMNSFITNYELPVGKYFKITPYWLLGFVEGEGSFFALQIKDTPSKISLVFGLYQTIKDLALMLAIKDFIHNLGKT